MQSKTKTIRRGESISFGGVKVPGVKIGEALILDTSGIKPIIKHNGKGKSLTYDELVNFGEGKV